MSTVRSNDAIYSGIIVQESYSADDDVLLYMVEVQSQGRTFGMLCTQMVKSGDIYNYEEIKLRFQEDPSPYSVRPYEYSTRVGENVIVAAIDGNHASGVILGSVRHPGRSLRLTDPGVAYASEFNGLETTIDTSGAYKVQFKGAPVNVPLLQASPIGTEIPPPIYNPLVGGSFFAFDKSGNYKVSDGAAQSIAISKTGKKITITSGLSSLTIDAQGKVSTSAVDVDITGKFGVKINSNISIALNSHTTMSMSAPQIAIGYNGIELFDSIIQIIDGIGNIIVNSPVGPCQPISTSPLWTPILALKIKLQTIKGSL